MVKLTVECFNKERYENVIINDMGELTQAVEDINAAADAGMVQIGDLAIRVDMVKSICSEQIIYTEGDDE